MGEEHLQTSRGFSQAQLLQVIHPVWQNARVWGAVYPHRRNCVRYLRDFVLAKLDNPATTRNSLKRELIALAKEVEEQGPPEEPYGDGAIETGG
jgi:hypothetical protein